MDDPLPPQSEYLQNRLRERKAESARAPRPVIQPAASSARDDDIFVQDGTHDALNKPRNNRVWQSSPMAPPSRAGSRSTGTKSTTSSQPRAIGAREMDAHVEKLSKQNFDLKLELYHRREKIEELERKLRDVHQLEADAAELMEVNQDLCLELEKRDRAIDEAVVMICDLEEKVRLLQEQAADTRPSSFTVETTISTSASACLQDSPDKPDVNVPLSSKKESIHESATAPVSTNDSVGQAELATPDRNAGKPRHVPSFLESDRPATNALRSMFVHGGRQIRPIPSAASLVSGAETKDDDNLDESPRSPNLSELSESDFKSIYGRTTPKQIPHVTLDDLPASPEESPVVVIPRERKLARTNQWVHDRAISPEIPSHRRSSSHGSPTTATFQSLSSALHLDREQISQPPSPTLARKQPLRSRAAEAPKSDPRLDMTQLQDMFPPTPDTLATRPTNNGSYSSIIQDKSSTDRVDVAHSHAHFTQYLESQARADSLDRDRAPRLFAYDGQQYYEDDGSVIDVQDFGASLFRHEGYAREAVSKPLRFIPSQKPNPPSLGGSTLRDTLYDSESFRLPSDPSTPRRRTQQARPLSVHMSAAPAAVPRVVNTLAPTLPSDLASDRLLHRSISLSPTPSQPSLNDLSATYHTRRTGDLALSPGIRQHRAPQKAPPFTSNDRSGVQPEMQHGARVAGALPSSRQIVSVPAERSTTNPTPSLTLSREINVPHAESVQPPKLASSIRQRMTRLTNRSNLSTPVRAVPTEGKSLPPLPTPPSHASIEPSPASSAMTTAGSTLSGTPTPTNTRQHSRSASATRRFFTQHRRRSSATPTSPTVAALRPSSKNGPDTFALRPRGSDTSEESARIGRTAAFLTAATAAAPFLSFDINKGAKPIPGAAIALSGPSSSSMSSPLRDTDFANSILPATSAASDARPPTRERERERRGSRSSAFAGRSGGGGSEKRMSWTPAGADGTMSSWRA